MISDRQQDGDLVYISSGIPGKPCNTIPLNNWITLTGGTITIPSDQPQLPNTVSPDNALPLGVCYLPKGLPLTAARDPELSTALGSKTPLSDYVLLVDQADCTDGVVAAGGHTEMERIVTVELSRPPVTLVKVHCILYI